jgi:hypothetical protein
VVPTVTTANRNQLTGVIHVWGESLASDRDVALAQVDVKEATGSVLEVILGVIHWVVVLIAQAAVLHVPL